MIRAGALRGRGATHAAPRPSPLQARRINYAQSTTSNPPKSATDTSIESISSDLSRLLDNTALKLSWPFGTVFLEKYGWDLVELDDEIELSRDVKNHQITVKFASGGDNPDENDVKEQFKKEVEQSDPKDKDLKEMADTINNEKTVPFIIGIHKLDASNKTRKNSLMIFCEAEPTEFSIEVTGLGGDETSNWGIGFEPLPQAVKDKAIDYLIEFGVGPDLAQFVCEYKTNMKGTNVPGLRRLKAFFDDK